MIRRAASLAATDARYVHALRVTNVQLIEAVLQLAGERTGRRACECHHKHDMSCRGMSRYVMSCRVMCCRVMPCHVISCGAM